MSVVLGAQAPCEARVLVVGGALDEPIFDVEAVFGEHRFFVLSYLIYYNSFKFLDLYSTGLRPILFSTL